MSATRQTIRQPLYRQFFGRCFNAVTRAVMGLPYADTQCGFKAFTRAAAQTVFQLQTIERWGFDPEILFIALKRGYRIVEVPVSWAHDERTRISYLKDGMRMLEDIAIVRWNALLGRYYKQVERIHRAGPGEVALARLRYSIFGITVDRKHALQVAFSSRRSHFARFLKSLR